MLRSGFTFISLYSLISVSIIGENKKIYLSLPRVPIIVKLIAYVLMECLESSVSIVVYCRGLLECVEEALLER